MHFANRNGYLCSSVHCRFVMKRNSFHLIVFILLSFSNGYSCLRQIKKNQMAFNCTFVEMMHESVHIDDQFSSLH